jgi:manganese oxidase
MRQAVCLLLFSLVSATLPTAFLAPIALADTPEIEANDNRLARGNLTNGVLTIELEVREGIWFPEQHDGPGLHVQAFAETGRPPEIPGPLIRVPQGTEIQIKIRNTISGAPLVLHGLDTRPGNSADTIQLAPGEQREVRFRADAPGTYYYWGTRTGKPSSRSLWRR